MSTHYETEVILVQAIFGHAQLGEQRRTARLVETFDLMRRHPGGTLPDKLASPADLRAFYRLCDCDDVTHAAVIEAARQHTLTRIAACPGAVLLVHDATELDYTSLLSLADDLGQIGQGQGRGYICQNVLAIEAETGAVLGLVDQVLHHRDEVPDDGSLLIPIYFNGPTGSDYVATVLQCSFDGSVLKYLKHGTELATSGGRGFAEPSLARYRGKYFLTLRNDAAAFVTTSADGLKYEPVKQWTIDDGQDLGSYNTQAHWLVHSDGLFLTYTRRGANNDHIARNRAPIFVAQVDPEKLQVIRKTEQALLPERGVMLGNFGATAITADESCVTDSEYILTGTTHQQGADGTTWLGRVRWSKPNQ